MDPVIIKLTIIINLFMYWDFSQGTHQKMTFRFPPKPSMCVHAKKSGGCTPQMGGLFHHSSNEIQLHSMMLYINRRSAAITTTLVTSFPPPSHHPSWRVITHPPTMLLLFLQNQKQQNAYLSLSVHLLGG